MVGQSLAHYRIVERIGAGGMGVVYKAEDLRLGRVVALKFLSPELASSPTAVERFLREARTASSLNHPNICTIYSIEECEGQRFLAMELLEGRSLVEVIGGRPMAPETVVELGIQIADALDAAHAQGVLHRDVKPANIFVTRRGLVKVLDFGLAKLALLARDSDAQDSNPTMAEMLLTTQGLALGTVAYMSPEQARGEPLDARSDIFSFGIVLYEMLTGQQAFSGRTSAVVFDAILNREPAALSLFRHDLPPVLDAIVTRALDKDVTGRFQSMAAARDALARLKRERESGQFLAVSPDLARSSDSASFLGSTPADLSASSRVPPASRAGAPVPDVPEDVDDETLSEDDTPTLIGRPPTISSPPSAGTFVPADSSPLSSGLSPVPTSLVSAGPEGVAVVAPIEALSPVVAASSASPTVVGAATVAAPGVALPAPAVRPSSTAPGRSKTPVALALIGAVVVVGAIGAWWALRNRPEPVPVPAVEAPAAVLPDAPLPVNAAAQQAIAAAAAGAVPADVRGAAVASRRQRAAVPRATPGPVAPVPAAAAPLSGTAIMPALPRASPQRVDPAALLLTAARTKYDTRLLDQAQSDVQTILRDHASSSSAPAACLLSARISTDQGHTDEAINALTRLKSQFPEDAGNAEGALMLARLLERSKRADRVAMTLSALGDVPQRFPESPWAPRALAQRALVETRERLKASDSSLGSVPAAFVTNRTLVEKYPASPEAEAAGWQLASVYEDRKAWDRAAAAYAGLATRFPQTRFDAWWRAGEIYEKRLKDDGAARAAYAKVPPTSPKYKDAQKRAQGR